MKGYMTFAGAARHDPAVDDWFGQDDGELRKLAFHWFHRLKACGDDVTELVHDNYPTACVEAVAFAYVGVFKRHVNIGFFLGTELPDPANLLEGSGKRMRHVKVRPGESLDTAALQALIDSAYADIQARLVAA